MAKLLTLPTQLLRSAMDYFWDFSQNDKRVAHWFLMEDVIPTTYICLFYVAFCIIAPKVLKVCARFDQLEKIGLLVKSKLTNVEKYQQN